MPYDFRLQKLRGASFEHQLDRHFSQWFDIVPATETQQRQGIDRVFTCSTRSFTCEYKSDEKADHTGNAFIETISADAGWVARGWAHTSQADFLIYYLPKSKRIYVAAMRVLRGKLPAWSVLYPSRTVNNSRYRTHGLLVPLEELAKISVNFNEARK